MGSSRKFGITTNLSGLSQGLMVNNISFTEDSQVAEARNQYGQLVDLAVYSNDKNVTIDGLYLGDMLSGGSVINIGSEQYMVTSTARGETNIGFQTGTVNAQRISGEFSPIPPQPPIPTEPSITFNIPNNIIWDFETNTTSSINFANYVVATPNSTGINYELTDQLYTTLPNGVVFNDGVLSANKSQMSDDYSTILSLNVSASFSGGTSLISTSPTFNFIVENVVEPVYNIPLTFKAVNSSGAVRLIKRGSPDPIVLDYSKNNGSWTTYNVGDVIELNQNDTVAFSGANDHFSKDEEDDFYYQFTMSGTIEASGNIQSLMNYSDSCTSACYFDLFYGCTSLITAPQLSATGLADACYKQMFEGCTSLTSAPALPATTLTNECYQNMFYGCTSLTTVPDLPATTLAEYCYYRMFYDCTSLTAAPELHGIKLAGYCYAHMFQGCTSLTDAPDINPTDPYLYFPNCCDSMFRGCTSLSSISVNFITWDAKNHYSFTSDWMYNVAPTGKFYKTSQLSVEYGGSRIPNGWTVINK